MSRKILFFIITLVLGSGFSWAEYWERQAPLPTGNTYNAVWGSSESDVYAVGFYGTIVHYNGTDWSVVAEELNYTFQCVWGSSQNDVYVGGDKIILHFNGHTWSYTPVDQWVTGIWGSSSDNVYAVCKSGDILHYDGTAWTEDQSPVSDIPMDNIFEDVLTGIWGSSSDNIYAVGGNGTIIHFDGNAWSRRHMECTKNLYSVWGQSASEVYVTGEECPLMTYDGSTWSPVEAPFVSGLPMWGDPVNNLVFSGGHHIYTYADGVWELAPTETIYSFPSFYACWSSDNGKIFAVGRDGVIFHYDGAQWRSMTNIIPASLYDVHAVSADDVYAVGLGIMAHYDGTAWTQETCCKDVYRGVWGSSTNDVYATGTFATLHYNGESWSEMEDGALRGLNCVWGSSWNNIYFAGYDGKIIHYDGATLAELEPLTSETLNVFWGNSENNIYIAGDGGTVLHYNGNAWSFVDTGFNVDFESLWVTSQNELYMTADIPSDLIYYFDGQTGSVLDSYEYFFDSISVIWGRSWDDLYFAGRDIFHFDGEDYTRQTCVGYPNFSSISSSDDGHVFAVGGWGNIFHLTDKTLPVISLDIPSSVNENDTDHPIQCSVNIDNAPNQDMILNIRSVCLETWRNSDIIHPETLVIPAGQTSSTFDIELVDNDYEDQDKTYRLYAAGYGWESVEQTMTIVDDESITEDKDDDDTLSCFISSL